MKRLLPLAIIPFLIFCNCAGGKESDPDFFQKLNMKKIAEHQVDRDIPDSSAVAGEYIYVPVYSSIYFRDNTRVYNLTVTLAVRNTDAANDIYIKEINYNNSRGVSVKKFLDKPVRVRPLETFDLVIAEDDTTGGVGANFIIKWVAEQQVHNPIVEAVMISIRQGVGLSFTETGTVLKKIR